MRIRVFVSILFSLLQYLIALRFSRCAPACVVALLVGSASPRHGTRGTRHIASGVVDFGATQAYVGGPVWVGGVRCNDSDDVGHINLFGAAAFCATDLTVHASWCLHLETQIGAHRRDALTDGA